jgi:putative DNA primase/helicase
LQKQCQDRHSLGSSSSKIQKLKSPEMQKINDIARGHWPFILSRLAGLSKSELSDKHGPCPLCGGKDRYRFDDDERGTWFCNQCGGKEQQGGGGTGMDLLLRKNNWSFTYAVTQIKSVLGVGDSSGIPAPPTKGAESVYKYSENFYVCRFPGKTIRPLYFDGSSWAIKSHPVPRPIFNRRQLELLPSNPVLITEGEKTAIAAERLLPSYVSITWSSGCKSINKNDWSPIKGKSITLWPDADDAGRQAMAKLAPVLLNNGAKEVFIVTPPENAPQGWDLADALWSSEEALDYLQKNLSEPITVPDKPEPQLLGDISSPESLPDVDEYFACLGFKEGSYYYQPAATGEVMALSRSQHTGTHLCAIAPLAYWENLYPSRTGVNWVSAASSLYMRHHEKGDFNPSKLRGRGAWWDNGRSVLHLGNRLVVDGEARSSNRQIDDSEFYYQRLVSIGGPDLNNPLSNKEGQLILKIANSFLWDKKGSGAILAGWTVLAPFCGILGWRPHIWLTAGAGAGKSTVLEDFVSPLLDEMGEICQGNSTEAGIRQSLKCDALPVVFDESEANEKHDYIRIQQILSLARVSSFESKATIVKGSADGTMQNFKIRSMFLFCSIAPSLKQNADRSRFAQLTLKNKEEVYPDREDRDKQWEELKLKLQQISPSLGRRLQGRVFSLIPVLRESVDVFCQVASKYLDGNRRNGDQYGTLLAGSWILINDRPPTHEEALRIITESELEKFCTETERTDERGCLDQIMQRQIRVEGEGVTLFRTIGELINYVNSDTFDRQILQSTADDTLSRNGIKVKKGNILFAKSSKSICSWLKDTPWANCWSSQLLRLPGASRTLNAESFKGFGSNSRAVCVPIHAIQ